MYICVIVYTHYTTNTLFSLISFSFTRARVLSLSLAPFLSLSFFIFHFISIWIRSSNILLFRWFFFVCYFFSFDWVRIGRSAVFVVNVVWPLSSELYQFRPCMCIYSLSHTLTYIRLQSTHAHIVVIIVIFFFVRSFARSFVSLVGLFVHSFVRSFVRSLVVCSFRRVLSALMIYTQHNRDFFHARRPMYATVI